MVIKKVKYIAYKVCLQQKRALLQVNKSFNTGVMGYSVFN